MDTELLTVSAPIGVTILRATSRPPCHLVEDLRIGVESAASSDVLDGGLDAFIKAPLAQRVGADTGEPGFGTAMRRRGGQGPCTPSF